MSNWIGDHAACHAYNYWLRRHWNKSSVWFGWIFYCVSIRFGPSKILRQSVSGSRVHCFLRPFILGKRRVFRSGGVDKGWKRGTRKGGTRSIAPVRGRSRLSDITAKKASPTDRSETFRNGSWWTASFLDWRSVERSVEERARRPTDAVSAFPTCADRVGSLPLPPRRDFWFTTTIPRR